MSATHCTGCNRDFTHPGYRRSHLSQTTNPACIAVREALLTPVSGASPSISIPQPTPSTPSDSHQQTLTTPSPTDCGPAAPYNQVNFLDEVTSHEGNALYDDEYVDHSVASDTGDEDDGSDTNDDVDNGTNCEDHTETHRNNGGHDLDHLDEFEGTEESLLVEPTIAHFPGRRVGEVCSQGIATMQEYDDAFGGPPEEKYFPFTSKTNWELAKWAKLRGPSATSFTELLNISGVSWTCELFYPIVSPSLPSYISN